MTADVAWALGPCAPLESAVGGAGFEGKSRCPSVRKGEIKGIAEYAIQGRERFQRRKLGMVKVQVAGKAKEGAHRGDEGPEAELGGCPSPSLDCDAQKVPASKGPGRWWLVGGGVGRRRKNRPWPRSCPVTGSLEPRRDWGCSCPLCMRREACEGVSGDRAREQ